MKIVSFNVNGIRSAIQKGLISWIEKENADFICLQEVKFDTPHLLNSLFEELGYHYNHWYPAQKRGYSGVAILGKYPPLQVNQGSGIDEYDREGRILHLVFENFSLLNVYVPSGTSGEDRQSFKMQWLTHFSKYIVTLKEVVKVPLIICGDFNIAHQEIDIHNPKANAKSTGFLPEERNWITDFLATGFVDTFRYINPDTQKYSWWTYRANARTKNLGWRIDYYFVTDIFKDQIKRSDQLTEICFSDHCPILLEIKV